MIGVTQVKPALHNSIKFPADDETSPPFSDINAPLFLLAFMNTPCDAVEVAARPKLSHGKLHEVERLAGG